MAETNTYYVLNVGGTIIKNGEGTTLSYGGFALTLSLFGLFFERKIYQPGHIRAEVMVSCPVVKDKAGPDLSTVKGLFLDKTVSLSVSGMSGDLASNYYVHEICPQFELNNGLHCVYVKLDIFSPDKLMMLNKYSRAYLGRKLIGDIVTQLKDDFARTDKLISIDLRPLGESNLQHLGYKDDEKDEEQKELIHPYLVQYNESFYDFLVRVANRCGEILYFEDGKLCFGVSGNDVSSITSASRVVYQRVSDSPLTVRDYARNALQGTWKWTNVDKKEEAFTVDYKLAEKKLLSEPIDNEQDGFPLDAFPRPEKANVGKVFPHYYNSEIASEDYYLLLYKDKFARDDFPDIWLGDVDERLMGWLSDLLNSTSLLELLAKFGKKEIETSIKCALKVKDENKKGNEVVKEAALKDENDYAVLFSKVDDDAQHWVTLDYYNDIRKKGEEQACKAVCVDMGTSFVKVGLGDRIKLPHDSDTTYVVVKVEMTGSMSWQRDYEDLASNPKKEGLYLTRALPPSQVIYAIPMYKKNPSSTTSTEVFYPPVLPGKPFRRSGPQPAFVVDNKDPKAQGRVRIRYPWQASLKESDAKVNSAESNLSTAVDTLSQSFSVMWGMATVSLNRGDTPIPLLSKGNAMAMDIAQAYAFGFVVDKEVTVTFEPKGDHKETDSDYTAALTKFTQDRETVFNCLQALVIARAQRAVDESATPWIRMTTPMATPGGGVFFRPEKGDEVMVDFENGNVERPYVVGSLYSKNVTTPAGSRVITSRNGHTIKMDDPGDATDFLAGLYPGFKFLSGYGVKLPGLDGKANKILGGIELTDQLGFYNIKMSSHNRNISISSPFGDIDVNALTGITIKAPNGDVSIVGKNVDITAYNNLSIKSGKNIKTGRHGKTGTWKDRAGYLTSVAKPEEVSKTVTKTLLSMTVGQFFDLSLIRTLLEIFIRPVDGTLQIKSNRYMLLEAGDGGTGIEPANYSESYGGRVWKKIKPIHNRSDQMKYWVLEDRMDKLIKVVNNFATAYISLFNMVVQKVGMWARSGNAGTYIDKFDGKDYNSDYLLIKFFKEQSSSLDIPNHFDIAILNLLGNIQYKAAVQNVASARARIRSSFEEMLRSALALKKHVEKYDKLLDDVIPSGWGMSDDVRTIMTLDNPLVPVPQPPAAPAAPAQVQSPTPTAKAANPPRVAKHNLLYEHMLEVKKYCDGANDADASLFLSSIPNGALDEWAKFTQRRLICLFVEKCRKDKTGKIVNAKFLAPVYKLSNGQQTYPDDPRLPFTPTDWGRYVAEITVAPPDKHGKVVSGLIAGVTETLSKAKILEENVWSAEATGQILFSDRSDRTYRFNDGPTVGYNNPNSESDIAEMVVAFKAKISI